MRPAVALAATCLPAMLLAMLAAAGWVIAETGQGPAAIAAADGDVDAVVALAGDPGRLAPARQVAAATGATLAISRHPRDSRYYDVGDRPERCGAADGDDVVCFLARPHATRAEARAVDRLAAQRGWDHLVVVTSRYHLRRAGLLVAQCLPDADVALMAADDRLGPLEVLREVLALGPAVTIHRAC